MAMKNRERKYKETSKKYFDQQSINYFGTFDGKYCKDMYEEVIRKIKKRPARSVLDVGCGTGAMLSMLIADDQELQVSGIDFSEKMLDQAAELLGEKAQLVLGDSDALPWQDDLYDLVLCNSSFHHFPEPLKVLKEIRRVLKADGRLIIADPWWPNPTRSLINLFLNSPFNYLGDVRIYSEQEIGSLLLDCGFKLVEWELILNKFSIASATAAKTPSCGSAP